MSKTYQKGYHRHERYRQNLSTLTLTLTIVNFKINGRHTMLKNAHIFITTLGLKPLLFTFSVNYYQNDDRLMPGLPVYQKLHPFVF